jgi:hypothetical protein
VSFVCDSKAGLAAEKMFDDAGVAPFAGASKPANCILGVLFVEEFCLGGDNRDGIDSFGGIGRAEKGFFFG